MQIHQELKEVLSQQWEVWLDGKQLQFNDYEAARHYYCKLYDKRKAMLICHIS